MKQFSVPYILGFSAAVCVVCSLLVSTTAVTLRERQEANAKLEQQTSVLRAAGLLGHNEKASREKVAELFKSIEPRMVDLDTGDYVSDGDLVAYNMYEAAKTAEGGEPAPANNAGIARMPKRAVVYEVVKDGTIEQVVLPISGKGLWSTLYGYLAVAGDGDTINGIIFYQHGETPGLGGEIGNAKWQARWEGRKILNVAGEVAIEVIKGKAQSPEIDPNRVDGISGATLTSRGVSHLVRFWVDQNGFGPYLERLRKKS